MRHGRKSSQQRFDGHKAALVVEAESQLITAVAVLPGNAPDVQGALALVAETVADAEAEQIFIAKVPKPSRSAFHQVGFPNRPAGRQLHLSGGSGHDPSP